MAIETEKKYRLDKKLVVQIAARLRELGADFAYERFEENYLHRGGLLDDRGAVLRLRKTDDLTLLTYKEKVNSDTAADYKSKIEFETEVSDVGEMESIIDKLGYRLSVVYEKHRKAWHFGNVEVVIDELPFGYFMEIEGPIKDIIAAEKELGADRIEVEQRGYPRLTVKYGKDVDGVMESRFTKTNSA
jgi:adenylate cyclase class 2